MTILSTLPSAGVGALLALQLSGLDFSLVALIGVVLLIGIVKKNAIMMIDFALEAQRERGMAPRDAIYEACLLRFRPIMMTTAAALRSEHCQWRLETGTGSELRKPLGDRHRWRLAAVPISHALYDACRSTSPSAALKVGHRAGSFQAGLRRAAAGRAMNAP